METKRFRVPWTPLNGYAALDLFAGIGGASRGLQHAGFSVVGWELDPQAVNSYRANVGPCALGDVRTAHPPCDLHVLWADLPQDGEHVGLIRFPSVEPGGSTHHAVRVMLEGKSACGVFSWSAKRRVPHRKLVEFVAESGYACVSGRVNLADYGLPQLRKYDVVVAWKKAAWAKEFQWPEPTHCDPFQRAKFPERLPWVGIQEVFKDAPYPFPSPRLTTRDYCPRPRGKDRASAGRIIAERLGVEFYKGRRIGLTIDAMLSLQGFPAWRVDADSRMDQVRLVTIAQPPLFASVFGREIMRVLQVKNVAKVRSGW